MGVVDIQGWPTRKRIPGVCNTYLYQYTNNRDIVGLSAKLFNRHSNNVTTSGKDVNTHQFDVVKVAFSKPEAAKIFNCTEKSLMSAMRVLTRTPNLARMVGQDQSGSRRGLALSEAHKIESPRHSRI